MTCSHNFIGKYYKKEIGQYIRKVDNLLNLLKNVLTQKLKVGLFHGYIFNGTENIQSPQKLFFTFFLKHIPAYFFNICRELAKEDLYSQIYCEKLLLYLISIITKIGSFLTYDLINLLQKCYAVSLISFQNESL